jgi:DNA methylase/ParB-like nuclease domain
MTATLKLVRMDDWWGDRVVARQAIVVRKDPFAARLGEAESRRLHEQISRMAIETVPVEAIKSNPRNAKQHPEQQVALIAENIRKFGVTHPVLLDETATLIGGHARIAAARRLKLKEVPAIRLVNLSPQEKRAVALADNKLAELGSWNTEQLRLELKELTIDTAELTFDYAITGFDTAEIDQILGDDGSGARPDPADKTPPLGQSEAAVTETGDLWVCGDHRLYCGSAMEAASYRAVLNGESADLIFADPLYSVPVPGHVATGREARNDARSVGHPTSAEFIEVLQTISAHIAGNASPGAVIYFCMDWRRFEDLTTVTRQHFGAPKDLVVWVKSKAERGSFYPFQYEHIAVYVAGAAPSATNLDARGRYRSNVWRYPGSKRTLRDWQTGANISRSVKPVALLVDALRDCSKRGQIVLDPCASVGTMMLAAERTGRRARLIEIDPAYCDVIVRRWQAATGKTAQLAESDQTFADLEARRVRAAAAVGGEA